MPLRPILRLFLASLLAGLAVLASVPHPLDSRLPTLDPPPAHADGPNDWPMFRHDPAHTGYNPDETQLKPPLRLKWSYTTGGKYTVSSPAVVDGVVYVGSEDRKVYALDAPTGTLKWSYQTGEGIFSISSSPAVADGVVYVGSTEWPAGNFYALDGSTGALRWSYSTRERFHFSSPAVADGVVYFGSRDAKVHALNATTGSELWSYPTGFGNIIDSSPAVAGGVVYIYSTLQFGGGKLYALDASTGTFKWSFATQGWAYFFSSPAVVDGVVYVGAPDGKVYALDAGTGSVKWSYATGGAVSSSPAVANGVVYVGSSDTKVYALEAATGAPRWSYTTGGEIASSPAVANGVVYVASRDKKVYALEAATGAPRWSYTTGGEIASSPAVANGVVYVGSGAWDGKVYAFEAQPAPTSMYPLSPYAAGTSVPVSWTVPITWTGTAAGSYDVQYRDGPSGAWTDLITNTAALSTTFNGQDAHTYYFRARCRTATGSLGDWSDPVSTTVDLSPPTGSLAVQGWASNLQAMNVTLSLSASDNASGLSQMQLSSDGQSYSDWEAYATSRAYTLPAGTTVVYGRFKDNAGNISQPVSATVTVDATPPGGTIAVEGWGSNYITARVTLRLSATDAQSGMSQMQLSTDGQAYSDWETYATSRAYTLPAGATRVYARFKDNAGNVSQPVSVTVTVDATPPTGWLTLNEGATYTNNRRVTVGLLAGDDLSGVSHMAFSSDGATYGDWQAYASLTTLSLPPGDGEKTLYARFMDRAGNVSNPASDSIVLDTTPPTTPAPDDGLTGAISSPTVTLQWPVASDALSGMERYYYKVDCGSESATSGLSATTPTLPDGDHTFYARARDQAGNYSPYGKHAFTIRATSLKPPDLLAPDSPTDRERINVGGVGPPETPIRLYLNCAYYGETPSGYYGVWQFRDVPLALGENVLAASIVESGGGLSPISLPAVVVRLKALGSNPIKSAYSLLTTSGGTVSAGRHALEVPAGALSGEAQVVVTPYGTEGAPPVVGKRSVGAFASIAALERGTGAPAQLQRTVRISLGYEAQALGGVSPSQLSVHYYDPQTSTWVALPSQVDTASRLVTAEASHLSDFALLADLPPMPVKLYLPLVTMATSGW